jgi:hypothetical protein
VSPSINIKPKDRVPSNIGDHYWTIGPADR